MELLLALFIYAVTAFAMAAMVVQLLTSPLWLPAAAAAVTAIKVFLWANRKYRKLGGVKQGLPLRNRWWFNA